MSVVTIRGKDGLLHRGLHNYKAGLVAYSLNGHILYVPASAIVHDSAKDTGGRAAPFGQFTNCRNSDTSNCRNSDTSNCRNSDTPNFIEDLPSILRRQGW